MLDQLSWVTDQQRRQLTFQQLTEHRNQDQFQHQQQTNVGIHKQDKQARQELFSSLFSLLSYSLFNNRSRTYILPLFLGRRGILPSFLDQSVFLFRHIKEIVPLEGFEPSLLRF